MTEGKKLRIFFLHSFIYLFQTGRLGGAPLASLLAVIAVHYHAWPLGWTGSPAVVSHVGPTCGAWCPPVPATTAGLFYI